MRALSLFLLLAVLSATASAQTVPALSGRVVDTADILSSSTESALTSLLAAHEDSTSNQIAVLTVPSLQGAVLEEYATQVFRAWGLGQADLNNGVLLLIARDDRKIRIEVGYGLEGSLTDSRAGAIIRDEMTPRFRDGDFDAGTSAAVSAIIGTLSGTYTPSEGGSDGQMPWPIMLLFGVTHGLLPMALGFRNLLKSPFERYATLVFTSMFVGAIGGFLGAIALGREDNFFETAMAAVAIYWGLFILADVFVSLSPHWQERRAHERRKAKAFQKARKSGRTSVVVDGHSYTVPTASSSSSGGGFSGGGGSSGGGGASGGW